MPIGQLEEYLRGFICHTYISYTYGSETSELQPQFICFLPFLQDDIRFCIATLLKCDRSQRLAQTRRDRLNRNRVVLYHRTPDGEFLIGFIHIT